MESLGQPVKEHHCPRLKAEEAEEDRGRGARSEAPALPGPLCSLRPLLNTGKLKTLLFHSPTSPGPDGVPRSGHLALKAQPHSALMPCGSSWGCPRGWTKGAGLEPSTGPAVRPAPQRCGGPWNGDRPCLERTGAAHPYSALSHCPSIRDPFGC